MTDTRENLIRTSSRIPPNQEEEEEEELNPSIIKEDITKVKGIGAIAAEKLIKAGFTTISQIACSTEEQLSNIEKIGPASARKIIENARIYSSSTNLDKFSNATRDSIIEEEILNEVNGLESDSNEDLKTREKETPWFDEKHDPFPRSRSIPPRSKKSPISVIEEETYDEEELEDLENFSEEKIEFEPEPQVITPKLARPIEQMEMTPPHMSRVNTQNEALSTTELKKFSALLREHLKNNGLYLIEKTPFLRNIYVGSDLIAVKVIPVNDLLELVCILPIKISPVKGSLIVSRQEIIYRPVHANPSSTVMRKPEGCINRLIRAREIILKDAQNEKHLIQFLNSFLKLGISIEKTMTKKNPCFHSGPLQYEIIIAPILVSQRSVEFEEKIIPFAYQKDSKVHVVSIDNFSNLLDYIDQKYYLVEKHGTQTTSIKEHEEENRKLQKYICWISLPFLISGILMIPVIYFELHSILDLLTSLSYGLIFIYFVILGFAFVYKFTRNSKFRKINATPYHEKGLNLDETSLDLINEELSPELMEQLAYECVENGAASKVLSRVGKINTQTHMKRRTIQKKVSSASLYEEKRKEKNDIDPGITEKYSSFMED